MNKIFKKILTIALALVCALSLVACGDANKGEQDKGLLVKKIKDVYTIYKYVDDGSTTTLDIAKELEELNITDTNIVIQKQAFNGNSSLKEIIVPSSVAEIEKGAFAGMKALESLTVPFIGLSANADYSVLVGASKPTSDKSVDSERTIAHFFGESEYDEGVLQTIAYGLLEEQTSVCYMPLSFKKLTVTGDKVPACAFNGMTKFVEIELTGAVEVIGDYAFANTTQIATISLPSSVKVIGECAFMNSALTEIAMPSALEEIKMEAFNSCKALTKISLNNGLKKIARYAFMGCEKLTTIEVASGANIELGNYAFADCEKLTQAKPAEFDVSNSYNAYPNA